MVVLLVNDLCKRISNRLASAYRPIRAPIAHFIRDPAHEVTA
jgi:hypothetical protein